jgi:apolipoprotein N-acyltransferase
MKKIHLILLSCLSGILFTIGWPVNGFPAFLFTALVPMFIIEDYIYNNRNDFSKFSVFFYTFTGFFVWNFLTTYWVWNSTPAATLAWTLNSMFMGIVFNVYHIIRRNVYQKNQGYFVLVFLWITFEFIHLNWKLTWTWLNLGNGFAIHYKWVQWYEYTGALGGTLWIIVANILIYKTLRPFLEKKITKRIIVSNGILALSFIILPIFISNLMYYSYHEQSNPVSVIATQPDIDPYTEQYNLPPMELLDININQAKTKMDERGGFIICPESAIQENIWESSFDQSTCLNELKTFIKQNPSYRIIIGAGTYKRYSEGEKVSNTARYHKKGEFYYDAFNTAFYIDSSEIFQIHHKSKLTPGVEYMPSGGIFKFLENFAIDLGGTVGTLGVDPDPQPFVVNDTMRAGPIICYESIFGEFCANYVKKGANILFIITNDGWWGDTPGYKQHFSFASLRAIETRRSIARSANTGISAFINQRGDVFQKTNYWEPDVIKQDLNLNNEVTFYTAMGDYLGRISAFLSVVFILLSIVFGIKRQNL